MARLSDGSGAARFALKSIQSNTLCGAVISALNSLVNEEYLYNLNCTAKEYRQHIRLYSCIISYKAATVNRNQNICLCLSVINLCINKLDNSPKSYYNIRDQSEILLLGGRYEIK